MAAPAIIDAQSPPSPITEYGRSKWRADEALMRLADDDFAVSILRLPIVYDEGSLGKLGQLLKLWRRIRVLPVPAADVSRSMISASMSAEIIAHMVKTPRTGVYFGADPRPFRYQAVAELQNSNLRVLRVRPQLTDVAKALAPSIGHRLFDDSLLSDSDNLAISFGLESRLYRDIANASLAR